ncbi:MAG: alpha-amylase family glycosyl hydrolase [Acidobacteriota bacterium]|nr:alpha-amylase family glycosyl hydrolase [Acidobacteriota bacterium]
MTPQPDLRNTPMGGTIVAGGATFRVWAPRARAVYASGDFNGWKQDDSSKLNAIGQGHWAGFFSGLKDGDQYLFFIDGPGGRQYKRDPYARELTFLPAFPAANCVLRNPFRFPWHETGFRTPPYHDLILYQLHVGTYFVTPGDKDGGFLDVIGRVPYLSALGVTAVQLMPVQEFMTQFSLGYNGVDYFSAENEYGEADESRLATYFNAANTVLAQAGQQGYAGIDVLRGSDNQLRALIDVCHVYGIAVLFDVVYNHAGGGFDANSLWFLDCMPQGNPNDSLYFTDQGWAGGQVFAFWNDGVRQFLIDNAKLFYEEYRVDGIRFDEVSIMDGFGGWATCQDMTATLRAKKPEAIQIAEYWPVNAAVVRDRSDGGAGFDATWHDRPRYTIRDAIAAASSGSSASVSMSAIAGIIANTGLPDRWRSVQFIENHDIVYKGREPRLPKLADPGNSRSWYARSRSRMALSLVLTAPGIPMIFMGQEILEDKQWNDTPDPSNFIFWQGLESGDKAMSDFLRFTRELIGLRRSQPALRGEGCRILHVNDQNRVLAFQRWVEGVGRDVVVVTSLNDGNWFNYQIGFPAGGYWSEVFNSDVYDNWVNPTTAGNGGGIDASGPPRDGLPCSASVTIPANGIVVFAR